MNIGFYGDSSSSWYGNNKSFINQIETKLNCKIVNWGVPQGSEERVLFDLKKTKKIDIAIIFHSSSPRYVFLPKCNRDVAINVVPENKSKILWSEDDDESNISYEGFEKEFFGYGKIKEVFGDTNNFIECMHYYRQYLTDEHHQLICNRYESAKFMIDAWCSVKCPKVIHIDSGTYQMPWFNFKSGISAPEIVEIIKNNRDKNPNMISDEGNILIANKLLDIMQHQKFI